MKKILYLGLTPPYKALDGDVFHYPIIRINARSFQDAFIKEAFADFGLYTHFSITSKTSIPLLFHYAQYFGFDDQVIRQKKVIAVGKATAAAAIKNGLQVACVADEETAEGMVAMLKNKNLNQAYLFWPHSALSRRILPDFFKSQSMKFRECIFYDTHPNFDSFPSHLKIEEYDEIVFTSPSTVDAYLAIIGSIPWHKQITPIGPVTAARIEMQRKMDILRAQV